VHETIDHASDAATRESALERMSELWASVPPSWAARPEAVELRQELAARAARLELAAGRPREARRWAERGLALDQDVSSLSAALWLVMADAYEAEGNTSEARGALKEALASHERLLERELEDP
jgi:tetratricopeptide (TPR) repeat protein